MMQNYKFTIAYDGTRFFGWERQPDRDTIQGKLEAVLSRLAGQPVEIIGAGRTDAGVHARAMVANAQLDVKESPGGDPGQRQPLPPECNRRPGGKPRWRSGTTATAICRMPSPSGR